MTDVLGSLYSIRVVRRCIRRQPAGVGGGNSMALVLIQNHEGGETGRCHVMRGKKASALRLLLQRWAARGVRQRTK
jgi:hypothetical protein